MKKLFITAIAALSLSMATAQEGAKTSNPILPEFHADPEILYSKMTGKYYIYSTTDGYERWGGWTFNVFSSPDLKRWTDEGQVLDVKSEQVKWAMGNAWAPAAIRANRWP